MLVFKLKKVGSCFKKFGIFFRQKWAQLTLALHTEELGQYRFDAEKTHTLLRNCCPCEAEETQCTILSIIVFATEDMGWGVEQKIKTQCWSLLCFSDTKIYYVSI